MAAQKFCNFCGHVVFQSLAVRELGPWPFAWYCGYNCKENAFQQRIANRRGA